ncbi:glycosyltransferase family 2 protein [Paenibacillus sp. ISL-20]|uniref:glycosyltransferase family 2 protein n=1 Tax=Paenibacillus sp. ISL-20 TaxID=2819163 RepID=UPI001BED1836|nr:glycosyltransferase family 2 protein [Paenibacillus sp. ISL-20]MBT2763306.1 glycosyltransferase family 2 protein [Paenibacillus sp. ISL-20]
MKILIIIPAFNEEHNITNLLDNINKFKAANIEVIVINDKSTDNTLFELIKKDVQFIDLPCNLGIGGAVQTGYKYANLHNFDIAIQVDGDGQHDPSYIEELINPIIEGRADMVIGSRYINKEGFQSTLLRRIGIRYFSRMIKLCTGQIVTDPTSGFRACNSKVISQFISYYPMDYPEPESIVSLLRTGYRITEIPVVMVKRENGQSSINKFKSIYYMIKVSIAILIDILRKKQSYTQA